MQKKEASFRFYEELNDFLPREKHKTWFPYCFAGNPSIKDAIEAIGVPHTEVDLILVNGESVDFDYRLQHGDQVSVYPTFESFDLTSVTRLRPQPLRRVRFILDVHLGKLARLLRMLGFDTYYRNDLDDREIVERAQQEDRIILTRDIGILKRGEVTHGYWVRSQNPKEQAREVVERFQLHNRIQPFHRCINCNGVIDPVSKEEVEEELLPMTREHYDTFYRCTSCGKIYWPGSHMPEMMKTILSVTGENRPSHQELDK
jgi:uncharacterized protein with PIN domain